MPIPIEKKTGIGGLARVTSDQNYMYITFEETPGVTHKIFKEDCPPYLVEYGNGRVNVTISGDMQKVYSARPCGGTHLVMLDSFVRKDNSSVPVPYIQKGNVYEGKRFPDKLVFDVLLKIVYGEYKGFIIPFQVGYAFSPSASDPTIAAISGTGMKRCEEFLDKFGLDFMNDTIPMSENILPWLEKTLLARKKKAMVELNKKGYVETLSYPLEGFDPSEKETQVQMPSLSLTREQAVMMLQMGVITKEQFDLMESTNSFKAG